MADRIQLLDQQLKAVDQDLAALLAVEPELARKLAHLTSVPGSGLTTAIVVVAETSGFVLLENERQLASYAGLEVVQRQSGLSAGAMRISRRGNMRLHTALYLPAVSVASAATLSKWLFMPAYGRASLAAYYPYYHPARCLEKEVAPTS